MNGFFFYFSHRLSRNWEEFVSWNWTWYNRKFLNALVEKVERTG